MKTKGIESATFAVAAAPEPGERVALGIRLRPQHVGLLDRLRAEYGLTQSETIEQAIVSSFDDSFGRGAAAVFLAGWLEEKA